MKRTFTTLTMCLLFMTGGTLTANAQTAKVAKKVIEVISKTSKKAPKKATPFKKTTPSRVTAKRNPYITTVTCSKCNGVGTVLVWNAYYEQYQRVRCPNCDGKGKISRYKTSD